MQGLLLQHKIYIGNLLIFHSGANFNTIEMRVFWLETIYPKSAVTLFFKVNSFAPVSGVSNEILYTFLVQGTAKLPNVKFGSLKKKPLPNLNHSHAAQSRVLDFLYLQLWPLVDWQLLELQGWKVRIMIALLRIN